MKFNKLYEQIINEEKYFSFKQLPETIQDAFYDTIEDSKFIKYVFNELKSDFNDLSINDIKEIFSNEYYELDDAAVDASKIKKGIYSILLSFGHEHILDEDGDNIMAIAVVSFDKNGKFLKNKSEVSWGV